MVLAIIFLLVAIVCIFGTLRSIKNRNFLAVFFAGATTSFIWLVLNYDTHF